MLTHLYIQNVAVIEKVYIDFDKGLNIFTGETGAGKSVVIDAINAVLGSRTSRDLVRTGEEKAVISAVFDQIPASVRLRLAEYGMEPDEDELLIQREISADGRTGARVCGRPVTVNMLREIGNDLINIHGQHDNQILLSPERHIDILDSFGDLQEVLAEYQEQYHMLHRIEKELTEIREQQAVKEQKLDMLTYQIKEITEAELELGEEEELESEAKALKNATKIVENLSTAYQNLSGGEDFEGAADQVSAASAALSYAAKYHDGLEEVAGRLENLSYELTDIAGEVASFAEEFDCDPARLNAIEERLDLIYRLKHKYGNSIDEILGFLGDAQAELERIETFDARQNELLLDQKRVRERAEGLADQMSRMRRNAADRFVRSVSAELRFLDMPNVRLEVQITAEDFGPKGTDRVEFLISTNPGEPPKPLAKIASGGELSRIMLSIKNTLADKDEIPTLIFDEVDTGVSGKAAQKIGLKLKQVAQNRQILSVTHLAQIAALADTHFLIAKRFSPEKTYTDVRKLDFAGRVHEVARIMSTGEITDLMLQNAEQMIRMGAEKAD